MQRRFAAYLTIMTTCNESAPMNSLRARTKKIEEPRYIARFPFGVSINPDGGEFSLIEVESLQTAPRDLYISLALCSRSPL